jgi:hypothetical protein
MELPCEAAAPAKERFTRYDRKVSEIVNSSSPVTEVAKKVLLLFALRGARITVVKPLVAGLKATALIVRPAQLACRLTLACVNTLGLYGMGHR